MVCQVVSHAFAFVAVTSRPAWGRMITFSFDRGNLYEQKYELDSLAAVSTCSPSILADCSSLHLSSMMIPKQCVPMPAGFTPAPTPDATVRPHFQVLKLARLYFEATGDMGCFTAGAILPRQLCGEGNALDAPVWYDCSSQVHRNQ